jgi:hypothetical protein
VKIEADFQVCTSLIRYKVLAPFCYNTGSRAGLCFAMGFMQGLKPKSVRAFTARLKSCPSSFYISKTKRMVFLHSLETEFGFCIRARL